MPIQPFWYTDTFALAASGSGVLQLPVSAGEIGRFRRLQFISTAAFEIRGIRDQSNKQFSAASSTDPIPNTMLRDAASDLSGAYEFNPPLEIVGPGQLNIDITDTSAAPNTVRVVIEGEKET